MSYMSRALSATLFADATALVFIVIAGLLPVPMTGKPRKNWQQLATVINNIGTQGLTLVPALSAFYVREWDLTTFWIVAFSVWFVGVVTESFATNCTEASDCSKWKKGAYRVGNGLQTAGVSFGVGGLVAYMRDEKI